MSCFFSLSDVMFFSLYHTIFKRNAFVCSSHVQPDGVKMRISRSILLNPAGHSTDHLHKQEADRTHKTSSVLQFERESQIGIFKLRW